MLDDIAAAVLIDHVDVIGRAILERSRRHRDVAEADHAEYVIEAGRARERAGPYHRH
ncbi:hypothetical protein D3C83_169780 [compost metagenome]